MTNKKIQTPEKDWLKYGISDERIEVLKNISEPLFDAVMQRLEFDEIFKIISEILKNDEINFNESVFLLGRTFFTVSSASEKVGHIMSMRPEEILQKIRSGEIEGIVIPINKGGAEA